MVGHEQMNGHNTHPPPNTILTLLQTQYSPISKHNTHPYPNIILTHIQTQYSPSSRHNTHPPPDGNQPFSVFTGNIFICNTYKVFKILIIVMNKEQYDKFSTYLRIALLFRQRWHNIGEDHGCCIMRKNDKIVIQMTIIFLIALFIKAITNVNVI